MLPGVFADEAFLIRFDKRADFSSEAIDLDWIGEDSAGIWVCAHPEVALMNDEALWPSVLKWRSVTEKALTTTILETLSNWETVIWLTMFCAQNRKEMPPPPPRNSEVES